MQEQRWKRVKYLNDLVCIICVHEGTINLAIKHLEILLVLINRLSLPLLLLLCQIILTDLVEEQHYPPFVTILYENGYTPKPYMTIVTVSVSC